MNQTMLAAGAFVLVLAIIGGRFVFCSWRSDSAERAALEERPARGRHRAPGRPSLRKGADRG